MASDYDAYWQEQRRKGASFEEAARAARRELFPELDFADYEPSITICRVCKGEGYHLAECKLKNFDGKAKPTIEDVMKLADTDEPARKSLIEVERERLAKLNAPVPKVPKEKTAPAPETP